MFNPTVFLKITVDGEPLGHVSFELFADKFPKTAENFHALSTGEKEFGFKGSLFLGLCARLVTSHAIMALAASPSTGEKLDDEHFFILKHMGSSILSMANAGLNTNSSQVFNCTAKTEWLHGKHMIFGMVKEGMNIVEAMDCFGSRNGKTSKKITIANCGQI